MTLTDTGPLVAVIDVHDDHHQQIKPIIDQIPKPLITTEACLTEALYLIYAASGWRGQSALWQLINIGVLHIVAPAPDGSRRAQEYMARFQDQPCDYADATLLIAAEDLDQDRIFTLDRHFYAYRLSNGRALTVIQ